MLIDHITQYVADPTRGSFDELALAATLQTRPQGAGVVASWREAQPIPADPTAPPGEESASVPRPASELFRQVVDATVRRRCLPSSGAPLPVLTLVPPQPGSSLSCWAEQVIARYGSPASAAVCGPRGVETARARSWAGGRQREGRPVLVLAAAAALGQWLELLARQDLRFRLPAGSVLVEVEEKGGAGADRTEWLGRLHERLGLPTAAVVRAYQPPGLTSWCCTRALAGGDPDLFVAPPWVRVRALEPRTLAETAPGTAGRLAVFDLANAADAGSHRPVHLLTDDLGVSTKDGEGGFRLVDREAGPE
jgi:hypothetical protein